MLTRPRAATPAATALAFALALAVPAPAAAERSPKSFVDAAGARIAYLEAGPADGEPIVFVHGLPFSSHLWRDVIAGLEDSGHRLLAPDLAGFGDSTAAPGARGVLDQAGYLGGFVDALGLEGATFVGHDWGAGIALLHAAKRPDTVRAFAFLEGAMPPVYPRPDYDEMPERLAAMFRSMREEGAERTVLEENLWLDTILPTMTAEPLPAAVRAEYDRPFPTPESRRPLLEMSRSLPIGGRPADVVGAYEAAVEWWTASPIPKLVMVAEPGRLFPRPLAEWTVENAPNATIAEIGPGLHAVQEESPEAVAGALREWLEALPRTERTGQFEIDLDGLEYRRSPVSGLIESAAVYGDRRTRGLYATHARVRAGAVVPPHVHPNTLTTVVTSGTAYVGVGERFDEAALVAYPEGSVFVTEAGVPHFIAAIDGDFSILDHGSGPSGTTLVDVPTRQAAPEPPARASRTNAPSARR